ncbi:transposase [Aeromonas sobria]|nr:transposase [Aeromonas sobria]
MHLEINGHGRSIKCMITAGTTADCTQAATLIDDLDAAYLLADRGYDANALIALAKAGGKSH